MLTLLWSDCKMPVIPVGKTDDKTPVKHVSKIEDKKPVVTPVGKIDDKMPVIPVGKIEDKTPVKHVSKIEDKKPVIPVSKTDDKTSVTHVSKIENKKSVFTSLIKFGDKKQVTTVSKSDTSLLYTPVTTQRQTINIQRGKVISKPSMVTSTVSSLLPASSGAYKKMTNLGLDNIVTTEAKGKQDMQDLNTRLACYIEKTRFLEAQNHRLVSELDDLKSKWGKETQNIKFMFKAELDTARKLLNDSERVNTELEIRNQALKESVNELKVKLDYLKADNDKKDDTIQRQNSQISEMEGELILFRKRVGQLESLKSAGKSEIDLLREDLQSAKGDLDSETLQRVMAENDKQSLTEEIEFLKKIHEQEMNEMRALITKDKTAENREYWKNEMSQCMTDIQKEYDEKLVLMKGKLESYYSTKLQEVKAGSGNHNNETKIVKDRMMNMESTISGFRMKMNGIESEKMKYETLYNDLQKAYKDMESKCEREKYELSQECYAMKHELEDVLAELQKIVEAKLSLELEIAAYRRLLENEETRVGLRYTVEKIAGTIMQGSDV